MKRIAQACHPFANVLALALVAPTLGCGGTAAEAPTAPATASAEFVSPANHPAPEPNVPAPGPVETAQQFFGAIAAANELGALSLVAPERREGITASEERRELWWELWSSYEYEVTDEVDLMQGGTSAYVSVRLVNRAGARTTSRVRFERIAGRWYMDEN